MRSERTWEGGQQDTRISKGKTPAIRQGNTERGIVAQERTRTRQQQGE